MRAGIVVAVTTVVVTRCLFKYLGFAYVAEVRGAVGSSTEARCIFAYCLVDCAHVNINAINSIALPHSIAFASILLAVFSAILAAAPSYEVKLWPLPALPCLCIQVRPKHCSSVF